MNVPEAELSSVFVYGTLMPGERWEGVAQQGIQQSTQQGLQGGGLTRERATLHGAALADLRPEGYPALFPVQEVAAELPQGVATSVQGWLYRYAPQSWPQALPFLDDLEGLDLTPPLYRRERVEVESLRGVQPAWVYFYARAERRNAPGFVWVGSGNWTDVPERHQEGEREAWEAGG